MVVRRLGTLDAMVEPVRLCDREQHATVSAGLQFRFGLHTSTVRDVFANIPIILLLASCGRELTVTNRTPSRWHLGLLNSGGIVALKWRKVAVLEVNLGIGVPTLHLGPQGSELGSGPRLPIFFPGFFRKRRFEVSNINLV